VLQAAPGRIVFRFHARDLHLVLGTTKDGKPLRFPVKLDGTAPGVTITARMSTTRAQEQYWDTGYISWSGERDPWKIEHSRSSSLIRACRHSRSHLA